MVCHSFQSLIILITAFFFLPVHSSPLVFQKRGVCATEEPDPSLLQALQQVKLNETQPNTSGSEARQGPIEIETWFHIISSRSEVGQVTDDMINNQVGVDSCLPAIYGLLLKPFPPRLTMNH